MSLERLGCGLELKFAPADADAKVGKFTGYGSIFNVVDAGGDMVIPGAFKATLKEWKAKKKLPKMLLQHGGMFGPAEDGIPVGKYTAMEEDEKGLYLEGELFALDTQKGKYIYEGLKSGELDGLSIGYVAQDVAYGKTATDPRRTLKKVHLGEVSIVTFPMNKDSNIEAVKSIEEFKSLSEAEAYLREVAGFSQRQAVAFVSRIKSLRPSDSETANTTEVAQLGARLLSQINRR